LAEKKLNLEFIFGNNQLGSKSQGRNECQKNHCILKNLYDGRFKVAKHVYKRKGRWKLKCWNHKDLNKWLISNKISLKIHQSCETGLFKREFWIKLDNSIDKIFLIGIYYNARKEEKVGIKAQKWPQIS